MMKKNILYSFLIAVIIISCRSTVKETKNIIEKKESTQPIPNLLGTKWKFEMAEDCINLYEFLEKNKLKYYSCETEDEYKGSYFIKKDTLFIHEFPIEDNSDDKGVKYKLVMVNNKLKHINRWSYSVQNDKWEKDDFTFDNGLLYEKVDGNAPN